jgi:uncharacterized damage-inducible protein DinB
MTIPMPDRHEPDLTAEERPLLTGFLDYYRDTLATKCAGLSAEQLAERAVPPSPLSLLGLVRHMGEVECGWFRRFNGEEVTHRYSTDDNPDGEFLDAAADPAQSRTPTATGRTRSRTRARSRPRMRSTTRSHVATRPSRCAGSSCT